MKSQALIDALISRHHLIIREIKRKPIFKKKADHANSRKRLVWAVNYQ